MGALSSAWEPSPTWRRGPRDRSGRGLARRRRLEPGSSRYVYADGSGFLNVVNPADGSRLPTRRSHHVPIVDVAYCRARPAPGTRRGQRARRGRRRHLDGESPSGVPAVATGVTASSRVRGGDLGCFARRHDLAGSSRRGGTWSTSRRDASSLTARSASAARRLRRTRPTGLASRSAGRRKTWRSSPCRTAPWSGAPGRGRATESPLSRGHPTARGWWQASVRVCGSGTRAEESRSRRSGCQRARCPPPLASRTTGASRSRPSPATPIAGTPPRRRAVEFACPRRQDRWVVSEG